MKAHFANYWRLVAVSVTSSCLGAYLMMAFQKPTQIIVNSNNPAQLVNYSQSLFDGAVMENTRRAQSTTLMLAAQTAIPTVVNIKAISRQSDFSLWTQELPTAISSGSGVLISPDGYIVTNRHVVEGSSEIEITLSDRTIHVANLVGSDRATDLALLKIGSKRDLPFLFLGNSDSLQVGEGILAIGNPFNLESTVTAGIVSAKGRSIDILDDKYAVESFIQTDAMVNAGNSGGALVNGSGQLVGINTAIVTKSGKYEGYSFSIPSNLVRKVVQDLKTHGLVQRAVLGAKIDDLNPFYAQQMQLDNEQGVVILSVVHNSAAEQGGLQKGDIVTAINQKTTKSRSAMQELLAGFRPGDRIKVEYLRKGQRGSCDITLRNTANTAALLTKPNYAILDRIGLALKEIEERGVGETNKSVIVTKIQSGSKIARTNMAAGFCIQKINDRSFNNLDEFVALLSSNGGKIVLEGRYKNYADTYYYAFDLSK